MNKVSVPSSQKNSSSMNKIIEMSYGKTISWIEGAPDVRRSDRRIFSALLLVAEVIGS